MADPKEIEEARLAWQKRAVEKTLQKSPERREGFETSSGIEVKRLYTPADTAAHDYRRDAGFPGASVQHSAILSGRLGSVTWTWNSMKS